MSETTKVINDIDKLFSETSINLSGQNVSAVELNDVLYSIEDSEARENIRTKTDQLQTKTDQLQTKADQLQTDINGIKELIPSQASSENKLADKEFVNSSVATNTAYFKGTFNSLAELEAVPDVTNNDYGFVKTLDAAGNVVYNRYKYNAESSEWVFEYPLNNSSFTAEQWSAINSGITSGKIAEIDEAISQIGSTNYKIFNYNGILLDSDISSITGYGGCTITTQNNIARIDFQLIIEAPSTAEKNFSYGINRDFLTETIGKQIKPIDGGELCFISSTQVDVSLNGYRGTFMALNKFWRPSRMYNISGDVGVWPDSKFTSTSGSKYRLIGTCYGIIE